MFTKDYNARLNRKEFLSKKICLASFPLNFQLSPTEKCNLSCLHCYRQKWKDTLYTKDLDINILKLQPIEMATSQVQYAWIVSGGESFLYDKFIDIIYFFRKQEIDNLFTITNGTVLNEHLINALVFYEFDNIKISIDGANPETVDYIRGKNVYCRILDFIKTINYHKKKKYKQKPNIIFSMVLMKNNYLELPELLVLAKENNILRVEAHHCQPLNDNVVNMGMYDLKMEFNNLIIKSRKLAKELNINLVTPPLFKTQKKKANLKICPCKQ